MPDDPVGSTESVSAGSPDVIRRGLAIIGMGIREEPRSFAVAVAGSSLFGLMTVASSVVLGEVTDKVLLPSFATGRVAVGSLTLAATLLVAVGVARAVGMFVRRLGGGVMTFRLQALYRRRVTRQYLLLPLSWHQRHSTGLLLSNANADVEATWAPILPLPFAVGVLVMIVVALMVLIATDPLLAVVGCVIFPFFGIVNVIYGQKVSPLLSRAQQLRAEVSGVAHESFDGALVIKTMGRERDETARFARKADELKDAMISAGRVRGLFDPVMDALPNIGVLAVLLVGTVRISAGALDVGDLIRVAYLFTLLAFPLRAIGWVFGELPRSVVGYGRVRAVLGARGEQHFGSRTLREQGPARLTVDAVTYTYPRSADADGPATQVLDGVSFDVPPGRVVALAGRTGSGKSTVAGLLVRLYDPDVGAVRIDGVDLTEAADGEVASAASLVSQQAFLFDDTVRGNVALGLAVDDAAVWEALACAQADRFVAALPAGLDTQVGERGTTLSGGQRQRIALARALVRQPRLLVLDDATSGVDPRIEAAILAGLRERAGASTVVVVAHRRATIELADEVVYLDRGRVAGRGSHDGLMATSPGYAALLTAYHPMSGASAVDDVVGDVIDGAVEDAGAAR
ncbi:ABC transporter ATP-binding protein [Frankia sp. Cr2]|uniref:ABC transporter ATP-binding protein n=1 Tax=Frankia sp. Cr2 TaxID=3073932 RepID=UPI002AD5272F|nr:ABC transporter ATP-binding protein [Frankia sp. Cr2]